MPRNLDIQKAGRTEILTSINTYSFQELQNTKREIEWSSLSSHTVKEGIALWLATLKTLTAKNYSSSMYQLFLHRYLDFNMTLQEFSLLNFESIIDKIKKDSANPWSECTRQARVACFISFTGFLARRFPTICRKAIPCRDGTHKTFFCVRDKVHTQAMSPLQWGLFLRELTKINIRDSLIAKLAIQGGKRINEVLSLTIDKIDWDNCEITFIQSKTRDSIRSTIITYPTHVLAELKAYLSSRTEGLVFISKTGKRVFLQYIAPNFIKAGKLANIPFTVTSHCLRASCVTYLKQKGISDSSIMKVTGHSSARMVYAYDKSDQAQNASKNIDLV